MFTRVYIYEKMKVYVRNTGTQYMSIVSLHVRTCMRIYAYMYTYIRTCLRLHVRTGMSYMYVILVCTYKHPITIPHTTEKLDH